MMTRPFTDESIKIKINECKEKGIALASVVFKIKEKSFSGDQYSLGDREGIAKLMVQRLHEKVLASKAFPQPVAITSVPYFDIDYFAVNDVFLKAVAEAGGEAEKVFGLLPPERRKTATLKVPNLDVIREEHDTLSPNVEEGDTNSPGLGPTGKPRIGLHQEFKPSTKTDEIEEVKLHDIDEKTEEKKENKPSSADQEIQEEGWKMVNSEDSSRRGTLLQEMASPFVGTPGPGKIAVPRMLVRHNSNDNIGSESNSEIGKKIRKSSFGTIDSPASNLSNRSMPLANIPGSPFSAGLTPRDTSIKPALAITTTTIGLLYRLTSKLQKRELMKNLEEFNKNMPLLKSIYGLHAVQGTTLDIKNQCLSKLGHFFEINDEVSEKLRMDKEKNREELQKPEVLNLKKSMCMSYFEASEENNKLFPESSIVTYEMLEQLEKFIPAYITSSGWEMLFTRIRDGASYQK